MRNLKLKNSTLAISGLVALSILIAPIAKAACGPAAHSGDASSSESSSIPQAMALMEQDDSSQAPSPDTQSERRNDSTGSILGLWKFVLYAGGELNDVGFEQFSAGGTELANDAGAFNAGNNFCVGAWKQVGPRTYDLVHPFFLFKGLNAIGVSIEKAHFLVSRDGNRFTGIWTQDNYDLTGNLIPGTHFDGTMSGTRIAPGTEYPFPLPL